MRRRGIFSGVVKWVMTKWSVMVTSEAGSESKLSLQSVSHRPREETGCSSGRPPVPLEASILTVDAVKTRGL